MHAGLDQILAEPHQHIGLYPAGGIDGGDEIWKNAMEILTTQLYPRFATNVRAGSVVPAAADPSLFLIGSNCQTFSSPGA